MRLGSDKTDVLECLQHCAVGDQPGRRGRMRSGNAARTVEPCSRWPACDRPRIILERSRRLAVRVTRLLDHELRELLPYAAPIEPDWRHMLELNQYARPLLPKVFWASEQCLGRSSTAFDDHKGSFSFPLLISATRGRVLRYLAVLCDVRGAVEIAWFRLRSTRFASLLRYEKPVTEELSRSDLNGIHEHLLGYLLGYADAIATASAASFYRTVSSERIVYGHVGGEFFEREFTDQQALEQFTFTLARSLEGDRHQHEEDALRDLLEQIEPANERARQPGPLDRR